MKTPWTKLWAAAAALAIGVVLGAGIPAQGQVSATSWGTFANVPLVVPANTTTNVLAAIDWRQGKTLAILPYFAKTNAGTDNVTFIFDVSYDGTNWSTTTINRTNACNGTTAVRGYHLILPTEVNGVAKIRLRAIAHTNTTDGLRVTNVVYSWSN